MTIEVALSVAAPILVAIVAGIFGYRQAVSVADRNSSTEVRKLGLQGYESLTAALQRELDEQKKDEMRLEEKIANLEGRIDALEQQRREELAQYIDTEFKIRQLAQWARYVLRISQREDVQAFMQSIGVDVIQPSDDAMALIAPTGVRPFIGGKN